MPLSRDQMDMMERNLRKYANEISKDVIAVDILRLMGRVIADSDKEEITAKNNMKGNNAAMNKLLDLLPKCRGGVKQFIDSLRHETFNGDHNALADKIEGITSGERNGPTTRNEPQVSTSGPLPSTVPDQVGASEDNFCLDSKKEMGNNNFGDIVPESLRVETHGGPNTTVKDGQARGNNPASSATSSVGLSDLKKKDSTNRDRQTSSQASSASSSGFGISTLEERGKIQPRPVEKQTNNHCAFCNGNLNSFDLKHMHQCE